MTRASRGGPTPRGRSWVVKPHVPHSGSAGVTEAKAPGLQAAYEKCAAILQCALAGADCVRHAAGMLESLLTVSYEQVIIDSEIIAVAGRVIRGIDLDEGRLAFDVIKQAGPGGSFLDSDHTVRHLRDEFLEPTLADRSDRESWQATGMEDVCHKAGRKVRELLAADSRDVGFEPVPQEVDRRVRRQFGASPG